LVEEAKEMFDHVGIIVKDLERAATDIASADSVRFSR
jgi:hypothetical protein